MTAAQRYHAAVACLAGVKDTARRMHVFGRGGTATDVAHDPDGNAEVLVVLVVGREAVADARRRLFSHHSSPAVPPAAPTETPPTAAGPGGGGEGVRRG